MSIAEWGALKISPPAFSVDVRVDMYKFYREQYYLEESYRINHFYENFMGFVYNVDLFCRQRLFHHILTATPLFRGKLQNSLRVRSRMYASPRTELVWSFLQDWQFDEQAQQWIPPHWVDIHGYYGPESFLLSFLVYFERDENGAPDYAMPVEVGSEPHVPPVGRLGGWAYAKWQLQPVGASFASPYTSEGDFIVRDPSLAWRLQHKIARDGTPEHKMMAAGGGAAMAEIVGASVGAGELLAPEGMRIPGEYWGPENLLGDVYYDIHNAQKDNPLHDIPAGWQTDLTVSFTPP